MSLEFRPMGTACNIGCEYCYQESTRAAGHAVRYDKEKVWAALSTTKEFWSLFGGEALLVPLKDLEELLELGFSRFGRTGVQTNGTLITPRHIELFDRYQTHVGISIDGPGELNDIRRSGTLDATRKMTARTEAALAELAKKSRDENKPHLMPSIIATLHAGNIGTPGRQARFVEWLHELEAMGLTYVNLHVMEMDHRAQDWNVSLDDQVSFLIRLWDESATFTKLRLQKFSEILDLLRGHDEKTLCVWHACDPWNTSAVQGLEGDGAPSHCTRTNKDGKTWLPAKGTGIPTQHAIGGFAGNRHHERQLSLYVTPQEDGGCKDCRFWLMCQGQCPGTGDSSLAEAQGDWRLRSSYCDLWKALFTEGERRLVAVGETPLSLSADRPRLEDVMYTHWAAGQEKSMGSAIRGNAQEGHGDHTDMSIVSSHGDTPHGDKHGDHTDEGLM